ncbi:hypothetical protein BO79DRAFT_245703 [Aspergillus costaricaensis CBS 115574]|uniref:Uncharacterized protein n=1 Tax=Aspergillus costaricaensis CBS 115574 TaxID=1448317 RepID=A0ACD1IDG0_9EURO|nr:hypothetical protein BO79DRAFT_245703 [Aspergillus costaricaensis CBS 115574]RAK88394.1 hypothetical protein BO79DRAFT_245703 [Aspergillus costaricaensis CBS 115574]
MAAGTPRCGSSNIAGKSRSVTNPAPATRYPMATRTLTSRIDALIRVLKPWLVQKLGLRMGEPPSCRKVGLRVNAERTRRGQRTSSSRRDREESRNECRPGDKGMLYMQDAFVFGNIDRVTETLTRGTRRETSWRIWLVGLLESRCGQTDQQCYIVEQRYKKEDEDAVQYPSKQQQQQQQQQQHFTFPILSFTLITAGQAGTASALPDPLIRILTLHTPSTLPCSWRPKIATIRLGAFGEKARLWRRVAERS